MDGMSGILKKNILSVVLLLMVISCTTVVVDEAKTDSYEISFGNPYTVTRAVVEGNSLPSTTSFKVWGGYGNDAQSVDANNLFDAERVNGNNGIWNYEGGSRYWVPGYIYSFYAVYPYELPAICSKDGEISVSNFDCSKTGKEAIDFMTASKNNISYKEGDIPSSIELKFFHELARVRFIIKNIGSASSVRVTKFKINGIPYYGNFSKTSFANEYGTWSIIKNTKEDDGIFSSSSFEITTGNNAEKNVFGDMLMIPVSDLTNAVLSFTYSCDNGEERTINRTIKSDTVNAWTHGSSYSYSLTVNTTGLEMNVSVVPWEEKDTSVSWE